MGNEVGGIGVFKRVEELRFKVAILTRQHIGQGHFGIGGELISHLLVAYRQG